MHHPTLILEDVGHLFEQVRCADDLMHMTFGAHDQAMLAAQAWQSVNNMTVVSSTPGCAPSGEHQAYR